jgi:hypothetical protein
MIRPQASDAPPAEDHDDPSERATVLDLPTLKPPRVPAANAGTADVLFLRTDAEPALERRRNVRRVERDRRTPVSVAWAPSAHAPGSSRVDAVNRIDVSLWLGLLLIVVVAIGWLVVGP